MKIKNKLPELLAPAGNFECLISAVNGGADAVYIGCKSFSARAYAGNFDMDEIRRAVTYCHLRRVRLYVAMNTLLYGAELSEAVALASELYRLGIDALIVADMGLVRLLREHVPGLELHASTQMSVHSTDGADIAHGCGCSRVVLARELSAESIRTVTEQCRAETEVFLHGALCVCHSGQCLFSSMIGGRSGNRGECAQPCRLPYNDGRYILSLHDLSLASHIRELIGSGVASLKIEGRMKSADYVYTVTSIYRRLLDEHRDSTQEENRRLERVFSRSGFTDGYFRGDIFRKMTGIRTEEEKRLSGMEEKGTYDPIRTPVRAHAEIRLGEPSRMTLSYKDPQRAGEREVSVCGAAASAAVSSPLEPDAVKARLSRMGNTMLSLAAEDIELLLDEGVNLSPGALNALRRDASEAFEFFGREAELAVPDICNERSQTRVYSAGERTSLFLRAEILDAIGDEGLLASLGTVLVPLKDYPVLKNKAHGVYIPPVVTDAERPEILAMLDEAVQCGARYALIGNISHIALVRSCGLIPVGDFRLNVMNSRAYAAFAELGIGDIILSPELTDRQSRAVGGRVIVYGRIPLMLTERCFVKENFGCERCGRCELTDRKGVKFPILREYKHRNLILNSAVTYMGDRASDIRGLPEHFIFTTESAREVGDVMRAYDAGLAFPLDAPFRRMGKR